MKGIVRSIIIGSVIIVIGVAILLIGLACNGWKFKTKLNFEMKEYVCSEEITALNIDTDISSVKTVFYEGEDIIIEYPVAKNFKTSIGVSDGELKISGPRTPWYAFALTFETPETVIKLPEGFDKTLKINVDTGSVYLAEGSYSSLDIRIDVGNFKCEKLVCPSLVCRVDVGKVNINSLDCKQTKITVDVGDINITAVGAEQDYSIRTQVDVGESNISTQQRPADRSLDLTVDVGKINLSFVGAV